MRHPSITVSWPHGWQAAAESIRRRLQCGNRMSVYVAPDGRVFVRNTGQFFRGDLPAEWLVGVFGKATPPEVVEDNLISRMREITEQRIAA